MSLTQEEKIDAIYEMLKKSETRAKWHTFFKIVFWITMLGYSYYAMVYTLPNLIKSFTPLMGGQNSVSQENISNIANDKMMELVEKYMQQK